MELPPTEPPAAYDSHSLEPQQNLCNSFLHMMQQPQAMMDALAAQVNSLNQLFASSTFTNPTSPTPATPTAPPEVNPMKEQPQHRYGQPSLLKILKYSNTSTFYGKESGRSSIKVAFEFQVTDQ